MTQQFGSTREMLQQIAFNKLTQDGTEADMAKGMLTSIMGDTVQSLAKNNESISISLVTTLQSLAALGYDADSDVAKSLIANSMAMQSTIAKLGETAGKLVNR